MKAKYLIYFLFFGIFFFSCKSKKEATVSKSVSPDQNPYKTTQPSSDDYFKLKQTFYDGCREKAKGNADLAEGLFKECLKIDANNAPANYELANIYRFAGAYDQALKCARIAAYGDEKNEWYNLIYIECLHNKRQFSDAASRYENLIKIYPYREDFYEGLAGEYIYAGKPEKALQAYSRLQQKTGNAGEDVVLQKVKLYRQLKKWDDAEAEIKKLIVDNPKETRYYTYLAEVYQDEGQPQKALNTYRDILKRDSLNPYVHLAMADYYRQERKDSLFFYELKTAFGSDELDIDSKVKILISYYSITEQDTKLLPQAYELCRSLIAQYPMEPKAHSVYADFLYRDKHVAEAAAELRRVLSLDKSKFAVWNQLLNCDADMNNFDSLAKHSAEAIDLFPEQPGPYYLNGIAEMRLKNYRKAAQSLKEGKQFVFENTPLLSDFSSSLAEVYNQMKEYNKSDKEFEEALRINPDNAAVLNNYAYYLSLRHVQLERAEKMSARSLEIVPNNVSYIDTYGWILFEQKKYEEAKKYLQKAFDKGGFNRPAIVEHYGDVMFKMNEVDKALEYWKKSRELGNKSAILEKKITQKKFLQDDEATD